MVRRKRSENPKKKFSDTPQNKPADKSRKSYHVEFLNSAQKLAWAAFEQNEILFLIGPAGGGKTFLSAAFALGEVINHKKKKIVLTRPIVEAGESLGFLPGPQPLSAKIVTKNGWTTMGDLKEGDYVTSRDGFPTKVTKIIPKGKKMVYKITTSDGTSTECCLDHLWYTHTFEDKKRNRHGSVKTTKEIIDTLRTKEDKINHFLPRNEAVQFCEQKLPLSPYTLGVLLGDGCLSENALSFASVDKSKPARKIINNHQNCFENMNQTSVALKTKKNILKSRAIKGLLSKKALEKSIPNIYKYSSIQQRLDILHGLMDTSGTVKKTGEASFCTTFKQLALDIIEIVRSLGGKVNIKNKRKNYEFTISLPNSMNPFTRKEVYFKTKYLHRVGITNIEPVCEKEVQCILVENKEHLYLTDNFIVTHNTFEEKVNPYMMPIYDVIDDMVGRDSPQREFINRSLEVAPLAYLRGRAEPVSNLIPTPEGLVKMGDLNTGDVVFGSNGKPTKITGVYPQGKVPVYKVSFSDHTHIKCSGNHLWLTQTKSEKKHGECFSVKNTLEIKDTLKVGNNVKNHRIPVCQCVEFKTQKVKIDPYLMGVLLGDGCFSTSATVTATNTNEQIIKLLETSLPKNMTLNQSGESISYRLSYNKNSGIGNPIRKNLKFYNLFGLKSYQKFIPKDYKFNSEEVRSKILAGLLDTDGCVSKDGSKDRIQFYSTSKQLSEDVSFLVRSLGGIVYTNKRSFSESDNHFYKNKEIKHMRDVYVSTIIFKDRNPFFCQLKKEKFNTPVLFNKFISNIEYVGEEECQCISVDASDSLYLTENFVVTHNTFKDAICILDEAQNCTAMQIKLFLTRLGKNSKMIITGDPKQSDLQGNVALVDIVEKLKDLPGVGVIEFKNCSIVRHPLVGQILDKLED